MLFVEDIGVVRVVRFFGSNRILCPDDHASEISSSRLETREIRRVFLLFSRGVGERRKEG